MITFKEILSEKEFALHRIETLVAFLIAAPVITLGVIIPNIKDYFPNQWIHLFILVGTELIIVLYWHWNRAVFPKCNSQKGNIVIAIITENGKQKTRITHDFKKEIEKQLIAYNLDSKYTVTVLHNHLSRITQNKINLYIQSLKAKIIDSEEVESFNKLKKKLNIKFIIYGDLIKRNETNSTYCLSLDALMCHSPTDNSSSSRLHNEFKDLWKREVAFLEENELTGFKENAEHVFFTASYMIGLATFIDNNFIHGIEIWKSLENFIKSKKELSLYVDKIYRLKSVSYILQSRLFYFNGEIEESVNYRNKYLELVPDEYSKCLNEAIYQIKVRNDPEMALEFVNKAGNVAGKEGTWRYSKFYLLIKLGKLEEAISVLDKILEYNYLMEHDAVHQVISYNNTCLKDDLTHIQTYFIIGVFTYKKLNMPIPAYEKLEEFVMKTEGLELWLQLNERAKIYLKEINEIIGVKN